MSEFADLVIKQDRSEEEDRELHTLAQQLDYVTSDLGTVIGPSGVVSRLRAGSVVLDNAGMHTFLGGVETGRIEADGDFLLGSNIATAATTSFAVFTNTQTYNSESIGAGDVLMGDNSSSKANILWDVSTGQLLFRGGTTTQGYIDTDGAAYFGGGDVRLGVGGMVLQTGQAATNQILWEDRDAADGTNYGALYAYHIGTTPNKYGYMVLNAGAEAGGNAKSILSLQAYDAAGATAGWLRLTGGEKLQYVAQAATDNNIVNMVSFERTLSGNAADGFGFRTSFRLDDDSSTLQNVGQIQTKWTDVSEAMARMDFFFPNTNTSFLAFDMPSATTFEMVVNDSSRDMDFRVETDGNTHTIFAEGSTNRVGILNSSPAEALDVTGNIAVSGTVDGVDIASLGSGAVLHSLADAANDFLVASGADTFVKKTLAETGAILEADLEHNNLQGLTTADPHTQYFLLAGETTNAQLHNADLELYSDAGSTKSITLDASANAIYWGVGTDATENYINSNTWLKSGAGPTAGVVVLSSSSLTFSSGTKGSEVARFVSDATNFTVTGNIVVSGTVDGIDIATDVAANTVHISSDGTDHAHVVTNDTHVAGDGSDHADVATNTTHISSDGTDHGYIDQDVQTTASPTFAGATIGGMQITGDGTSFPGGPKAWIRI